MSAVRAVVFDLDGTLFDHAGASASAVERFFRDLGVELTAPLLAAWSRTERREFDRWRRGEIDFVDQRRARLAAVLPVAGLEAPRDPRAADALFDRYLAEYRSTWRSFDGSRALVEGLRASGYRVGLLTNGTEEQQRDKLTVTGLARCFDAGCTSERIGVAKPDARAFTAAAAELGVEVSSCLFVGDDPLVDVAGARAAGMQALLVDPASDGADGTRAAVLAALGAPEQHP